MLHEAGAAAVSAYVTHAVFPNESWRKFVAPSPTTTTMPTGADAPLPAADSTEAPPPLPALAVRLSFFWITNSNPVVAARLTGVAPFEVLSITPVLEDLIGV